jgi:uncharacterized protein YbaA (DUF1428 family)
MPKYVDGFVLPIPKEKVEEYKKMASLASGVWREHGALDYRECVLEDPTANDLRSFPLLADAKEGETVVLAWITYESRAERDRINALVMKDPRLSSMCGAEGMPFDPKRMAYGGFETLIGD